MQVYQMVEVLREVFLYALRNVSIFKLGHHQVNNSLAHQNGALGIFQCFVTLPLEIEGVTYVDVGFNNRYFVGSII
jgi:hypothetical protein